METYLFIVIILLVIAAIDLMVGVANDAVNFLSSSIGAKAASLKVILIVASLGVLFGVTFSSGMMEIARSGVIHPEHFLIGELMAIFFAVMITDILLLDLFNTFGLPTSTTVSIVSELFGAGVALAIIKLTQQGQDFSHLSEYINVSKVFAIFTGIFLSIVAAFLVGSLVQFISRAIFTFDYKSRIKRYGALWGSLALTLISYFILIKGAKGASFISIETMNLIQDQAWIIMLFSFVFWAIVLHLLIQFTKVNILKVIVLAGTFALAMAFAANDLVNFIGVPLAALSTYTIALSSADPLSITMEALKEPVQANTLILLLAGAIMVATLVLSHKARSVTKTTLLLGRQDEGYERFESLPASRAIVRMVLTINDFFQKLIPESWKAKISQRLDVSKYQPEPTKEGEEAPSFDLVRAAVNLMVAAGLISFGTSLKLPLSTTYVAFIVAMATALPDKAWGRESAVFRVSGVLTVIGGWLFTAFIAASVACAIAFAVYFGEFPVILGFVLLSAFAFWRTNKLFKKRTEVMDKAEKSLNQIVDSPQNLLQVIFKKISEPMKEMDVLFSKNFSSLFDHKLSESTKINKKTHTLLKHIDYTIQEVMTLLRKAKTKDLDFGHKYGQAFGALHDMSLSLDHISSQCRIFIDNNHKPFIDEEKQELKDLITLANKIIHNSVSCLEMMKFNNLNELTTTEKELNEKMQRYLKRQIKRASKHSKTTKRSILFINLLEATRNISRNAVVITTLCYDIQRDFETNNEEKTEPKQKILPE